MSDFDKAKVAFALALLATVFTVHPIVIPELGRAISLGSLSISLRQPYLSFVGLLVLSVYFFAWDMVTGRPVSRLRDAGTTLYAVALVLPPLTAGLAIVGWGVQALGPSIERFATLLSFLGGAAASLAAGRTAWDVRKMISAVEKRLREARAVADEASHLSRAEEMLRLGHNDLAALEAWKSVEVAVASALFRRTPAIPVAVQPKAQLDQAQRLEIIPGSFIESAQWLRRLRNEAAHGGGSIDKADAERAVRTAVEILGAIARPQLDSDAA